MNESVLNWNGIRLRVMGTGDIIATIYNIDATDNFVPSSFDLDNIAGQEPFVLANINSQRVKIRLETNNIDDQFNISRIILYAKPIWEGFPG